ncbi:MAG: aminopeptidase [Spirochaetaceae bacterium]
MDYDKRWADVARILVDYSTGTRDGDRCLIIMRETESSPLMRAVYARAIERGAYPQVLFSSTFLERDLMKRGSADQIAWEPELFMRAMDWADVCVDLRAAANLYEFADIDSTVISAHRKAEGAVSAKRTQSTRWTICRIPTAALAQQAGRSLDTMMDFFFEATLLDWEGESAALNRRLERLGGTKEVRITAPGTDLKFSTEGRSYVAEDGHINMPGGELFTAPVEDSVEGHIYFEDPGVFAGTLMEDIRLDFAVGEVVSSSARTNEGFLREVLAMDDGARRVGEFGIGTNPRVTFASKDILYDEKIFGTIHIALGRSYSQCGGKNQSALHWDIVKDLRRGGTVTVDGVVILEDGKLLI